MGFSVKTISIIVAANVKGLEKGMGKANKSLANFASGAARMGSLLTFSVTAPLAALGKTAVDTFAEFEDSMMKVNVVTGATQEEFGLLQKEAKRLGQETRFTARQFADLQLILGRKGFDPSQIIAMEESIAKLALATGEDLSLAAETVSASLKAFNLDADESSRVANTLAQAAATSSIQLSTFATAFGHAGSSAKAVGVTVERLSAMMGVLMDNGIKASKAGTGLRKIFSKLNQEGIPFNETLEQMASGQMTLNDATALVGETASNQLLILSNNLDKVNELTQGYINNTTALDKMAAKMDSTTKAKLLKLNSALETLKIKLGELIVEFLMPFIEKITRLAKKFSDLDKETQIQIIKFTAIAGAIGPVLIAVAALTALIGQLKFAFTGVAALLGTFAGKLFLIGAAGSYLKDNLLPILIKIIPWIGKYLPQAALKLAGAFGGTGLQTEMNALIAVTNVLFDSFGNLKDASDDIFTGPQRGPLDPTGGKGVPFLNTKIIDESKVKIKSLGEAATDALGDVSDMFLKFTGLDKLFNGVSQKVNEAINNAKSEFDFSFNASGDNDVVPIQKLSLFSKMLNLTAEQIVTLNESTLNILGTFSQGFVNLFEKQVELVEINGELIENNLTFAEKFASFAKGFLIDIAKMIAQATILATLMEITGFGKVKKGVSFGSKVFDIFGNIMGFADGGRPPVGKMSLVGERGPELFVPGSSGTIIPNHALGGGGSAAIPDVRISGDDLLIVFDRANRRKGYR